MKARLLIVDDEPGLCEMLADSFRLAGYEVETALDGKKALALAQNSKYHLIISDVNMPGMNGLEFIESLRALPDETPAIMLSAKNERPDINAALKLGADDYVSKPFGLEELALRVAAVLRRTMDKSVTNEKLLRCGPISLDEDSHQVFRGSELIDLSPTEFRLLKTLMMRQGKMVTKATLLSQVWDIGFENDSNVVSTYVSYLRRKLHTEDWEGIHTVRGLGFKIVENSN